MFDFLIDRFTQVRSDPQKGYKWLAQFPMEFQYLGDPLNVEKISATLPGVNAEPFGISGTNFYYPSTSDISSFSATFYLGEDLGALQDIIAWKQQIQNPDGTFNLPIEYKKDVDILLLDGGNNVVGTLKYIGVFPTQTQELPLDYSTSERVTIIQQFSVDSLDPTGFESVARSTGLPTGDIFSVVKSLLSGF